MLSFFRRIRQNLVDDGKLRKYLLYAAGEIILIVVSIMLALQINNWNETRLDRQNERALIYNIIEDLVIDSQAFQSLHAQALVKQSIHVRLYQESIAQPVDAIINAYSAEIVETTNLISKTWDNHKNSVEKLSGSETRKELNEYFRNFQLLQEYTTTLNNVILNELRPYLRNNELLNLVAIFESNPSQDDFDRLSFFNNEKLLAEFGTPELNSLILELYLGTQDVIQWLETLIHSNSLLRSRLQLAALE